MVGHIDSTNISNYEVLEGITQEFTSITEKLWYKYFKDVNIKKHYKTLQNITKHGRTMNVIEI